MGKSGSLRSRAGSSLAGQHRSPMVEVMDGGLYVGFG